MNDDANEELIDELRKRIAMAPHDLALRFELGAALHRTGDMRSAIPELQLARQHPGRRLEAMRLLAEAFAAIGMHDLADHQRRAGANEDGEEPPAAD